MILRSASASFLIVSRSAATSVSCFVVTLVELKVMIRLNDGLNSRGSAFASSTASAVQ
jgi:hypothetical protein